MPLDEKNEISINIGKKEAKLLLFSDDILLHIENLRLTINRFGTIRKLTR